MSAHPELPAMFCDRCERPHRVDLSGPRCHACRMKYGRPPLPTNPRLVRVEAPAPMVNARMAGIDQHCQEIPDYISG